MSPRDLDHIEYSDAKSMWELYQRGMAGPSVQYVAAYNNFAMLNTIKEILIAVNSKNHKPEELMSFDKVFRDQYLIMALRDTVESSKLSSGSQAALALEGAPQWIVEAAMEEIKSNRKEVK